MEPFDAYTYFKTIIDKVGINSIKRCTGLANLEEIISSPGTIKPPALIVEDSGDGYLNLSEGNFDSGYYLIYIVMPVKINNMEEIHKIRKSCKKLLAKLFLTMMNDPNIDQDVFSVNTTRIDYSGVGPLTSSFYGYSAGFTIDIDFSYDE